MRQEALFLNHHSSLWGRFRALGSCKMNKAQLLFLKGIQASERDRQEMESNTVCCGRVVTKGQGDLTNHQAPLPTKAPWVSG